MTTNEQEKSKEGKQTLEVYYIVKGFMTDNPTTAFSAITVHQAHHHQRGQDKYTVKQWNNTLNRQS